MFFSKLKKINKSKKGLPENLLELQESADTVWVWDPDYNMLVWANDIGMGFWKAKSRIELKELVFPQFHPMMQVSLEALNAVKKGKSFTKGLPLVTYPEEIIYECHFTLQILPDGREGLLVTIPASKQSENIHPAPEQAAEQAEESLELLDLEDNDVDLASLENTEDMLAMDDLNIPDNILETESVHPQADTEISSPTEAITPQILVDETLFTAPLTISVHENGFLLGADERTNFYIQANPQTRFEHLFTTPQEAAPIINTALQSEQNSFVVRLTIQKQDLPFIVQTVSLIHEGQRILNVAMLRITQEQYHDHITTLQDAQQINEAHEHKKILTEDDIENAPLIVEEVTESAAITAAKPTESTQAKAPIISDSTTTAMFETDKKGIILDCNNMSKTLTGLFKEDLVGRHIGAVFDEHTAQNISHFIEHNETDSGEYVDGKECYFHGEDNSNRHGIVVIRPVQHATNGFLFLLTDNTEVKNIQKDIDALKKEAKQEPSLDTAPEPISEPIAKTRTVVKPQETKQTAISPAQEKIVPDYLAHISHELRAPLNAISGYTELLKSEAFGTLDPHYRDYIQSLHIATHHAKEVVDDLLDYAKLEAGGFTANISETDLSDVIENTMTLVKPQATFKNIDIQTTLFTGTPNIKADPRLLKQVLCNILSNAIKYSDENENIYIAAGVTKTKRFMIEVTNFGAGMTEEQIETAMQPYGRLQNNKNIKGTGLGLPLAKRFTELMDGHFLIHSVPNDKTRVRIIFEEDKVIYADDI